MPLNKETKPNQRELNVILSRIKNRKAAGLDKIPPKTRKSTTYFPDTVTLYMPRNEETYGQKAAFSELQRTMKV